MYDKSKLGARYTCFQCGTKFYDLNRPLPTCPECGADQREAPVPTIKQLLTGRGRPVPSTTPSSVGASVDNSNDDDDDDFDDVGLGDDDDDNDDDE